ncbi:hypothetical protein KBT16_27210 [Nostoc sp. CCCryo 231-06]|nr:hypothetical protein [Nostoc sp. CCCryo 231-06]
MYGFNSVPTRLQFAYTATTDGNKCALCATIDGDKGGYTATIIGDKCGLSASTVSTGVDATVGGQNSLWMTFLATVDIFLTGYFLTKITKK